MTRQEYMAAIRRRSEIRQELGDLQQTLARENRDMNDAERAQFNALRAEDDSLMVGCTQYESARSSERSVQMAQSRREDRSEVNFARLLRSIVSGRGIPQDLAAQRDENGNFRFAYNRADEMLREDAGGSAGSGSGTGSSGTPSATPVIQQAASTASITPVYIQDYIRELTPQTIIGELGARIQSGINGQWNFPTVKGLKATWYGENEEVLPQTMEFGVKTITPHRLPIRVDISNRAINQTGGAVRDIVVETMRLKHTLALNEAFVSETPAANAPTSPFKNIPTGNVLAATGAVSTLNRQLFLDLRSKVNAANVPVNSPAYLMSWNAYAALANTPIDKGSGRFVLDLATNTIDGVKVVASSLVKDGTIYYGNFGYAMVGQFGAMTMGIDTTSVSVLSTNTVAIVINSEWDFFAPYPEAFGKITYTVA